MLPPRLQPDRTGPVASADWWIEFSWPADLTSTIRRPAR